MSKFRTLDDAAILSIAIQETKDSSSYYDSDLSKEREDALKLYNGGLPKPSRKGTSKYTSFDVFDVVESLKAQLLETFSGNRKIVRFVPPSPELHEQTKLATEVADYVYCRYNEGYSVNRDVIHDALMGRNGVAKAYWEKREKVVEEEFTKIPEAQLIAVLEDEDVELTEIEEEILPNPQKGLVETFYTGILSYKKDLSNVRVKVIPPEDFIISSRATSIKDSNVVGDKCRKSKGDLLREGYPEKEVNKISTQGEGFDWSNTEKDERLENREGTFDDRNTSYQEQVEEFWVYEVYIELDVKGDGHTRLWKVTCTDDVLLDKEVVEDKPYFSFCPLPVSHSFYGANFVDRVKPIQNAKTTLTRSILEHTVITNNPRLQVLSGTAKNPREILDNRIGGIINVTRLDGIAPLPQSSMNPFAFSVLEMLDSDKEDNTSVSRLSKGMNKDAISKQNSSDMVSNLVTLSMQRQKIIARNFAEEFLKPLYLYIIKLVIDNSPEEFAIEVAGKPLTVDVTDWEEQKNALVEFRVGYQEDEKEAQQYIQMHNVLSSDPSLGRIYGEQQKYEVIKKALEAQGIHDVSSLLTPPESLGPPQPNPAEILELELKKQEAQVRDRQTKVAEIKAETERMRFLKEMALEELQAASTIASSADRQDLEEEKFLHKREMDIFEKEIVRREAAKGDVNASASVTGTVK